MRYLDRRMVAVIVSGLFSCAILLGLIVLPVPYVIEYPGPTFNTLGNISGKPVVEVEGREISEDSGELLLLTVSVLGSPGGHSVNALQAVSAWLNPDNAIVPRDFIYPSTVTAEEDVENNRVQMASSQELATAVALDFLGIEYGLQYTFLNYIDSFTGNKVFEPGDILLSADEQTINTLEDFSNILNTVGAGNSVETTVLRGEMQVQISVPVYSDPQGKPFAGINVSKGYKFPLDINILLKNVGGPSGGLVFALTLVDVISGENITNGKTIAATGTISSDGKVGPVGGVPQKMVSAARDGAKWFLVSEDNCAQTKNRIPENLRVIPVNNFTQAHEFVKRIGTNSDLDSLPKCA